MTLTFQLKNQKFENALVVSVNGESKELTEECREVCFEVVDTDEADVQVEYISKGDIKQ